MRDTSVGTIKNPFEEVSAANLDDEHILKYWACPQGLFENQAQGIDIKGLTPTFVFGGRGTGKTTVLKYLSFEIQKKEFMWKRKTDNLSGFLSKPRDFLGIYYRFEGPQLAVFSDLPNLESKEKFRLFVELVLAQRYLRMIEELIEKKAISQPSEKNLCKNICEVLYGENIPNLHTLEKIRKQLAKSQYGIESSLDSTKTDFSRLGVDKIPSGRLLFELPNECEKFIPELSGKKIFYLFDEYENLEINQQLLVNTFIKHKKYSISFKIGSRLNGVKTYNTLNNEEYLKSPADFRFITVEDTLTISHEGYRNLLLQIAKKRLENNPFFSQKHMTDLKSILGERPTPEQEAKIILKETSGSRRRHMHQIQKHLEKKFPKEAEKYMKMISHPENPLYEKLNILLIKRSDDPSSKYHYSIPKINKMMIAYVTRQKNSDYEKYKNLYDKHKLALLFQLAGDYRTPTKKLYVGFDTYAIMSSGIIRNFLELCYTAFNYAIFGDSTSLFANRQISNEDQNIASYEQSERFFRDARSIPDDMGIKVTKFVENIGTILRILHKDEKLSEPEPTYFTTEYDNLDKETKKIIDTAVKWSFFHRIDAMLPKDPSQAHLEDFVLNRMLCPKYTISYRRRGRTFIKPSDLDMLVSGTDEQQKRTREKITKVKDIRLELSGKDVRQPTLADFFKP